MVTTVAPPRACNAGNGPDDLDAQGDPTRSPAPAGPTAPSAGNDTIHGGAGGDGIWSGSGYDTALVDYDVFTWVFDADLNIESIFS